MAQKKQKTALDNILYILALHICLLVPINFIENITGSTHPYIITEPHPTHVSVTRESSCNMSSRPWGGASDGPSVSKAVNTKRKGSVQNDNREKSVFYFTL